MWLQLGFAPRLIRIGTHARGHRRRGHLNILACRISVSGFVGTSYLGQLARYVHHVLGLMPELQQCIGMVCPWNVLALTLCNWLLLAVAVRGPDV